MHDNRSEILEEIIKNRRSVRHFTEQEIPTKDMDKILEAGIYAPSGSNAQNQRFLVIEDKDEIKAIGKKRYVYPYKSKMKRKRHPEGILGNSAALVLVFSDNSLTDNRENGEYFVWKNLESQNCSASIQNMLLMATSLQIGSVWISCAEEMNYSRLLSGSYWRKILYKYDIPDYYDIHGLIMFGYPKSLDSLGYPRGEKKHGVIFGSIERKEINHYTVKKRDDINYISNKKRSLLLKIQVKTLSMLTKYFLRSLVAINKRIFNLEYNILKD